MARIEILNWAKFQHYKDRSPPWIKLHRSLLDKREWRELSGDASKLLADCWLLASETPDGAIEFNTVDLAWRLRRDPVETAQSLIELARQQFLKLHDHDASNVLANRLQRARPEGEERGEGETEAQRILTETRAKALGASAGLENAQQNGSRDPWDEPEPDPDEPPADAKNLKAQLAYFMPLLRRLNYAADQHDGSILKALLSGKAPRSPPSIDKAIRGLAWARDKGALRDEMGLGPDDQLTMKILYSDKGVRPAWQKAVDQWYPQSLWKPKGSKDPGLSPIRVV